MNRDEAQDIFRNSEEIVTAGEVLTSVERMANAIKSAIGEEFPLVL